MLQPSDGGLAEHVRLLACDLSRHGHHVAVAGPPQGAVRTALRSAGIAYHDLDIVGSMVAPAQDARSLLALVRLLRAGRWDLVHLHGQKAGLLGRLAAAAGRTPVVYTPHGFIYRSQLNRPRRGSRLRFHAARAMERCLARQGTTIVAVCDEERRAAIGDRIVPAARIHLVRNGVDPDRGAPPHPHLRAFRGEGPLFAFVGVLREIKGLPVLLDALERLAGRQAGVRAAIVGNGPLRDEVEERVRSGVLSATTVLLPFEGRMEPYLAACDALVLPSNYEGLPLAVLEAMALGVAVVATAVGGTPEAVDHGRTGWLFAAGDAAGLATRLAMLADDPDLLRRAGAAGLEDARARFTAERMTSETEAVYRSVVAAGVPG